MKKLAVYFLIFSVLPSASFSSDVTSSLRTKMKYLGNRQAVISQNIANANTPKYKSKDLEPISFGKGSSLQLATTSPGHLGGTSANKKFKRIDDRSTYETAPDGNNVILEEQMVKMSHTDMEYSATTSMLKQINGLMRIAIGTR